METSLPPSSVFPAPSISRAIALALILRRNRPALSLRDSLDAARFLLAAAPADIARYRRDGLTNCVGSLRSMAHLAR